MVRSFKLWASAAFQGSFGEEDVSDVGIVLTIFKLRSACFPLLSFSSFSSLRSLRDATRRDGQSESKSKSILTLPYLILILILSIPPSLSLHGERIKLKGVMGTPSPLPPDSHFIFLPLLLLLSTLAVERPGISCGVIVE